MDLASKGVRVNAVNPGVIVTDIHRRSGLTEENYEKFLEHSKTTHALGRVGTVQEVAAMISFLASEQASFITGQTGTVILSKYNYMKPRYISGQTIGIDGGRGIMCPR